MNKANNPSASNGQPEVLIKSKQRVKSYGEVFTPSWMVEKMLDEVSTEASDIHATFLEPAAGDGNFLMAILRRKLASVQSKYNQRMMPAKSLFALASIYGIEIQKDNLYDAHENMLKLFVDFHNDNGIDVDRKTDLYKAARYIIKHNIVWGNTLTKRTPDGADIIMSQWQPVPKTHNKVERKLFVFGQSDKEVLPEVLSLFDIFPEAMPESHVAYEKRAKSKAYKIVDIRHVYKEQLQKPNLQEGTGYDDCTG